jgi:hypothetical protein
VKEKGMALISERRTLGYSTMETPPKKRTQCPKRVSRIVVLLVLTRVVGRMFTVALTVSQVKIGTRAET